MRVSTIILIGTLLGLIGCDHATKHTAQTYLNGQPPIELVSGVLDLRYAQNFDIGFNLLQAIPATPRRIGMLTFGCLAIMLLIGLWRRRLDASLLERAGYALLIAGALGNLLDRFIRGYVIDFIYLHHWPIFNVADVTICLGATALFLGFRQTDKLSTCDISP